MIHALHSRSAFLAALPMIAAAYAAVPAGAQSGGVPLKVGATPNDTYAEAYYAEAESLFSKAGLDVQITSFGNGAAVSAGVASGALDIGISNPVQIGNAVSHGVPFVFIAGGGMYNTAAPTTVLCVAKNAPIRNPKEFEGQAIAVSALKDVTDLGRVAYLQRNGVDADKVKAIELRFAEMGPALARGTVAGAIISEPSLTNAVKGGEVRVFAKAFDAIAPHFLIGGWFTTKDWYAKNTETAKKFVNATYATAKWANAHHDQSAEILAKVAKLPPETTKAMTRATYAENLDPKLIEPMLQLAGRLKVMDRPVNAAEMLV